jgi:hypothetical protein
MASGNASTTIRDAVVSDIEDAQYRASGNDGYASTISGRSGMSAAGQSGRAAAGLISPGRCAAQARIVDAPNDLQERRSTSGAITPTKKGSAAVRSSKTLNDILASVR